MHIRNLRWLALAGASLAVMAGANAAAQTSAEGVIPAPAQDALGTTTNAEVIIVTGSQIRGAKIDDVLPITVVDELAIETMNVSSGDELFRAIPQAGGVSFNDMNTTGGVNSARGDIASINLRELGTGNTLLLLNGRRMVNDPGFQTELLVPVVSPDTNSIAPGGIRRVEVLRDGASALYGADAVAGVVNTILRSNRRGGFLEANYRPSPDTKLFNTSVRGGYGFDFNGGKSNITVYGGYFHENGVGTSARYYAFDSDRRQDPRIVGTPWEGDLQFDNRSTLNAWGQFRILGAGAANSTDLRSTTFHIQPNEIPGCRVDLGNGICAHQGTVLEREIRYNLDSDRDLYSRKNRYNATLLFNHEFSDKVEFYTEGTFYRTASSRQRESNANLTALPIGISRNAYWNPFGPVTFPDGTANPNRLDDAMTGNTGGRDLRLERYRVLDAGPRLGTVTKNEYRFVAGLRGDLLGWDFDTGFVYHEATKNDLTRGRISLTAFQNQINLSTPDAYNPFNGGCYFPDSIPRANGDCTPSSDAALDAIRIDVFRKGKTTLALADFKISRSDLLALPGGDLGVAAGVEWRRESFIDDRDPRLDGTITFTDSITGNFFGSDVLGSSPSPDTSGSRNVYSGFAELFVPLVSPEMDIPLVRDLSLQLAGRFEHFDDIKETAAVPRIAASWTLFRGLMVRGAWSQGFRAPNLVQVNDAGTTRVNTRDDFVRCFAQIQQGQIATFDNCVGVGTISLRTGTDGLVPEDTASINLGVVLKPDFISGLTLTADFWRVKQKGIVGVFGDGNAIALDLLRRLQGSSNPNVLRADPNDDDIALFAGTGLAPVGRVLQVLDPYLNLDQRIVRGWDFGLDYRVPEFGLGQFQFAANVAYLDRFFQSPGPEGLELVAAVEEGALPDSIVIANIGELRRLDGRPKWRWTASMNWSSGPFRAGLFGSYISSVENTSVTQDALDINGNPNPAPGSFYQVADWFTVNATFDYTIRDSSVLNGTRLRLGVNNLFGKDPPLADVSFGFLSSLHNARGRQLTFQIRRTF